MAGEEGEYGLCPLGGPEAPAEEAARILFEAFRSFSPGAWPSLEAALEEVRDCLAEPNFCLGIRGPGGLLGWVGLRPMYELTWELHPLAVDPAHQGRGLGRRLLAGLEDEARRRGLIGIVLGTDDEAGETSLAGLGEGGPALLRAIAGARNLGRHPFEFYGKCGYAIVGLIPNANGPGKPDIWMWKDIRGRP